ncbi:hypothetical protein [Phocaeicola vulgatus]|uniref:hypothetical protein n=1 Tax=Phocaeicola vulgatus TaxID=821 RepID=UPI00202F934A|nr:hypothetical protein [Phocaeicola vulgatus]MCM1612110.1 hypothetical protein [Phocaeicola vulgatus]MCM1676466.1 hypothetical protein [Phocaeicola vulgatus]MCM1680615.1 hypothetical protein [Phocaeicola vulgatus]MCM1804128.1 hypothetical protein [Phocaeicola vulgatus]MCM1838029.1 hypothetical protein [Phocaeicola vulgatus]
MNDAVEGLTEIQGWSAEFNTTSFSIAGYITAAMLAISLIFVVWALATKKDNAKTYLIAWFVALIFSIVFILR